MKEYFVCIETKVITSYKVLANSKDEAMKLFNEGKTEQSEVDDTSEVESWVEEREE